jgi:DNA-binding transcriptional ArsR family regulator
MNGSRLAAQSLMACLGEESRFRLVQALIGGARCVTDLASEVGLSQSCTTRHLQALESRRVVSGKREGKRVLYRIRDEDPGLLPLLRWALDRPGGSAAARSLRSDQGVPEPAPQGGDAPVMTTRPSSPAARRRSGQDRAAGPPPVSAPPAVPPEAAVPDPEPEPPAQPTRRVGSDIEDYLL